jgi:hypothetical protein
VPRRYTEQQFRAAIDDPDVRTMADLCRALGIVPRGGNYETLRLYAARQGVDLAGRLSRDGGRVPRRPAFPAETTFREIVARNTSLAGVIRELGWPVNSTSYRRVHARVEELEIDLDHLHGRAWANGVSRSARRVALRSYLRRGQLVHGSTLRRRLVEEGLKDHRCEACNLIRWRGRSIPLELDHIDGDRTNNELQNLRLLCPNCHALTPTYRGRNIGRGQEPIEVGDNPPVHDAEAAFAGPQLALPFS